MAENKILLSILIPTVVGREEQYGALYTKMEKQLWGLPYSVEFIPLKDNKEMTIGEKREKLYSLSTGLYSVQWDDDDDINEIGIKLICEALDNNPNIDCCTYEEYIDIDGKIQRSNHSLKYNDWCDNFDGFDYCRTPFMKSVIKTEIAKSVPIPHIRFGEDHQWAQALKSHLHTEIHIDEQIYKYIHRSSDFNERYGIKD